MEAASTGAIRTLLYIPVASMHLCLFIRVSVSTLFLESAMFGLIIDLIFSKDRQKVGSRPYHSIISTENDCDMTVIVDRPLLFFIMAFFST
jgi:hypothetical protein